MFPLFCSISSFSYVVLDSDSEDEYFHEQNKTKMSKMCSEGKYTPKRSSQLQSGSRVTHSRLTIRVHSMPFPNHLVASATVPFLMWVWLGSLHLLVNFLATLHFGEPLQGSSHLLARHRGSGGMRSSTETKCEGCHAPPALLFPPPLCVGTMRRSRKHRLVCSLMEN